MIGYASGGVAAFAVLLVGGWWLARRSSDATTIAWSLWAGAGAIVALAVNQPIVAAAHTKRPFVVLPHALQLAQHNADYGFPSDHATMAGAVAAGLIVVHRILGAVAAGAAVLMAFARVYVGVHWPADVVAGLGIGAVTVLALGVVVVPLLRRAIEWACHTRLRPLVIAGPDVRSRAGVDGAAELLPEQAEG